jgi:hypothetical protein
MSNNSNGQSQNPPIQRAVVINDVSTTSSGGGGSNISVEKLAEKVYQLMLRDMKLEQERRGKRHR